MDINIVIKITPEHVKYLRKKVFKILPLFEQQNLGLSKYIHSFIYKLDGFRRLVDQDKLPQFDSALSILIHLYEDSFKENVDLVIIKREVLHCSDLIKKSFKVDDDYGWN